MEIYKYQDSFKQANWPMLMRPVWEQYFFNTLEESEKTDTWKAAKKAWIEFVTDLVEQENIYIAEAGQNDDHLRETISKIVIHHSHSDKLILEKSNSDILKWINALQLIRQYGDYFSNSNYEEFGKPVYSGHYLNGKQIFIAYHWLIFPDGEMIQALSDERLGWHCKSHNKDSIGICLIGDFTNLDTLRPTKAQILACRKLCSDYSEKYKIENIFGHRELVEKTTCPGNQFLGINGWKNEILLAKSD